MSSSYPTRQPRPDEAPWRDATLYGIAGWYTCQLIEDEPFAAAFGGYFRVDTETGRLSGELIDFLGKSGITGRIDDDVLIFSKHYEDVSGVPAARYPVVYRFTRENGTWVGSYQVSPADGGYAGQAACSIVTAVTDAFGVVIGPING